MSDPQNAASVRLAAALNAQEPDALPALFDAYGDQLFRYGWFMLRNRDVALIALRDTLVVAQAHVGRLADPRKLDSWLYALAHSECRRRRPVPASDSDEPPTRPSQPDADSRLMAWNAVTSMDAVEMEVLDLACRHDVDLGLVLGVSGPDARALLDRARQDLERALGAEILVSRGSHACPDRVEVMRGWAGTVTPELRERVLRHAAGCPVCGPNLPRNVSAARVFALLPAPALPVGARQRVLAFFGDPRMVAYREFAIARAAELTESGFPLPVQQGGIAAELRAAQSRGAEPRPPVPSAGPPADRRAAKLAVPGDDPEGGGTRSGVPRARVLALAGVVTATAAAVAAALVLAGPGSGTRNPSGEPATSAAGPTAPRRAGAGAEGAVPISKPTAVIVLTPHAMLSPGEQLFAKVSQPLPTVSAGGRPVPPPLPPLPRPTAAQASPSAAQGSLAVSPGSLDVGTGSQGQLVITAEGAAEAWQASPSSGQLGLSSYGSTLQAGQSVTLTVTVSRAGNSSGSADVYIQQGTVTAQTVQVIWSGVWSGSHQQPQPSPSPTWTPSPVPSPSPSPSNSSGSSPPSGPSSSPAPSRSWRPGPTPPPSGSQPPPRRPGGH